MRVGILGGTFDPVHVGHLIIAEEALSRLALDQVLFIPAGQPWLKADQALSPAEHRLKMVELAIASNPRLSVSRIEVDRPGPTYTVDTLERLKRDLGEDVQLYFILGLDALEQFHRGEQPARIIELWQLAIASRPGFQNSRILDERLGRYPNLGSKVNFVASTMDAYPTVVYLRSSKLDDLIKSKHTVELTDQNHENPSDALGVLEETHDVSRYRMAGSIIFPVHGHMGGGVRVRLRHPGVAGLRVGRRGSQCRTEPGDRGPVDQPDHLANSGG